MKSHLFNDTIIRSYDIRGVYNKTLKDIDARVIGNIFGLIAGKRSTINVGYDGRVSSINLKEELIKGLLESDVNVNEIGLGPTPMMYFSCFYTKSKGGIMVTGSHNPKDHNGFKFVLDNLPFYGEDLKELEKLAKNYSLPKNNGKKNY